MLRVLLGTLCCHLQRMAQGSENGGLILVDCSSWQIFIFWCYYVVQDCILCGSSLVSCVFCIISKFHILAKLFFFTMSRLLPWSHDRQKPPSIPRIQTTHNLQNLASNLPGYQNSWTKEPERAAPPRGTRQNRTVHLEHSKRRHR